MRLLRGFTDQAEIEGTTSAADRARHEKQVAKARVQEARRTPAWTELQEADLVERGDLLVSASTDAVYMLHPGIVFAPSSTDTLAVDHAPLYFTVHGDKLTFLERMPGTWSEHVARQARKDAARR